MAEGKGSAAGGKRKPAKKKTPAKRKRGQPTKCTPKRTKAIAARIEETGHVTAAVRTAGGIDPSTHFDWVQRGERGEQPFADYAQAISRAKNAFEERLVAELASSYKYNQHGKTPVGADRQFLLKVFNPEQFNVEYKVKVMDDANEQLMERLRAGLDAATFAKVVEVLVSEGS